MPGAAPVTMTAMEREALIVDTLPLIRQIAHKMAMRLPSTLETRDLVNAGVLGLLDAIDKFEPERGVKFKTYAEVRIRGAILDSLRSLDWAPRSLRKEGQGPEPHARRTNAKIGQAGHRRRSFRSSWGKPGELLCPD
jgi:RNA polymerase sigma factor for flagellar operon FliA